ncbi:MAG: acyltransferase [Rhodoferax sp.]|nr:acyltransferase [Rhodoferax sp.]
MKLADQFPAWKEQILQTPPHLLEELVRGLLIHYYFHVSDKGRMEIFSTEPGGGNSINAMTPTQFKGAGRFRMGPRTVFGVPRSPGAYSSSYFEARTPDSLIEIGDQTVINNQAFFLSEGAHIRVGQRGLFGPELQIFDSNAHRLKMGERHLPDDKPLPVEIGDDVFIGSRVTILKGCRIANGCVISAGSVLPPSFEAPAFSIIAGNPARVVGKAPAPEL